MSRIASATSRAAPDLMTWSRAPLVVLVCLAIALAVSLGALIFASATTSEAPLSSRALLDLLPYAAVALSFIPLAALTWSVVAGRRRQSQLMNDVSTDLLTGLPNRLALEGELARATHAANATRAALLLVDLGRFEDFVDRHGRAAGERLVKAVGDRLKSGIRAGDHLSRIGEDVFAIVQEAPIGAEAARAMAERLLNTLMTPFDVDGLHVLAEANVGIALKEPGVTPATMLERADLALRDAKSAGRGTCRFFSGEMGLSARNEAGMAERLRTALQKDQFEVHYQPILRLEDGGLAGYEALLRWKDGGHGFVPPLEFIPVAEKTGLIVPIGAWVLEQACMAAVNMPKDARMTVNISAVQLRHGKLAETVAAILAETGLEAERLELEVTEFILIDKADAAVSALRELTALGVKLALDDFGTGYASLRYLDQHSVDHLKIDRALVSAMITKTSTRAIVEMIIALAHELGVRVVGEGVETQEQYALLRDMGCDEAQGYLTGRPAPAMDVEIQQATA